MFQGICFLIFMKLKVFCFDVDVFILCPRFLIITEVLRMWIHLTEDGVLWRDFMDSVMSFPVPRELEYS